MARMITNVSAVPTPMDQVIEMLQHFVILPTMPYTDITIQIADSSIRIHSALLCSFSPFVSSILSPLPTSSPHPFLPGLSHSSPRISVTNISKSCLPLVREMLYTGFCMGTEDEMKQVEELLGILGLEHEFALDKMLGIVMSDILELAVKDGDSIELRNNHHGLDVNEENFENGEQVAVQEGEEDMWGDEDQAQEQLPFAQDQYQFQAFIQGCFPNHNLVIKPSRSVKKTSPISKRSQEAPARNSFFCSHCHMKFTRIKDKEMHALLEHSYEQPFLCQECGARFKIREDVEKHMHIHGGGSFQIQCEVCDQVCKSMGQYHIHYKAHSGLKEFVCCKCGKSFSTFSNLKSHEVVHKPMTFSCEACEQMFRRKHNLKAHFSIHHKK